LFLIFLGDKNEIYIFDGQPACALHADV